MINTYSDLLKVSHNDHFYVMEYLHGRNLTINYLNGYMTLEVNDFPVTHYHECKEHHHLSDLGIYEKLKPAQGNGKVSIKGVLLGEGIDDNPYELDTKHFFVQNIIEYNDEDDQRVLDFREMSEFCYNSGLEYPPLLRYDVPLPSNPRKITSGHFGSSRINKEVLMISKHYRTLDNKFSFVVSRRTINT